MIKSIKKAVSTFVVMAMITTLMPMIAGASPIAALDSVMVELPDTATPAEDSRVAVTLYFDTDFSLNEGATLDFEFVDRTFENATGVEVTYLDINDQPIDLSGTIATVSVVDGTGPTLRINVSTGSVNNIRELILTTNNSVNPAAGSNLVNITSTGSSSDGFNQAAYATYENELIEITGKIEPFITVAISDNEIEFGDLTDAPLHSNDDIKITVNTNALKGYETVVESTPFSSDTHDLYNFTEDDDTATFSEGFGFNFVENVVLGFGADPDQDDDDRNSEALADGDFENSDRFATATNITPETAFKSEGPSKDHVYTLSVIVKTDEFTPAGSYASTIKFRTFGTF